MKTNPPAIEPEIVREIPRGARPVGGANPDAAFTPDPTPIAGNSIHPLAAFLLIAVDNLWNMADWAVVTWIVTIPLAFLSVFVPTYYLQRRKQGLSWFTSFGWALLFGLAAAIPFSVAGTAVGATALAWLGINRLNARPPQR